MTKIASGKSKRLYIKLTMLVAAMIVVTIIALTSIMYQVFENAQMDTVFKSRADSLHQIGYSISVMEDTANMLATQVYFDRDVQRLFDLFATGGESEVEVLQVTDKLRMLHLTYPMIDSIYVYNKSTDMLLSDSNTMAFVKSWEFHDQEMVQMLESGEQLPRMTAIPRVKPYRDSYEKIRITRNVYSFVYYSTTHFDASPENMVVVSISEEWVKNQVKSMKFNSERNLFLVDASGHIVMSGEGHSEFLKNVSDIPYVKRILESSGTGYFTENIRGEMNLVIYSRSEKSGWSFVNVIPFDVFMGRMESFRNNTLLLCLIILAIGLIAAVILMRYAFTPVDRILNDASRLRQEGEIRNRELRKKVLQELLYGSIQVNSREWGKYETDLGVRIDISDRLVLVLFRIDGYAAFKEINNISDRSIYKFGFMNIIEEVFTEKFPAEIIDMNDDKVVVMIKEREGELSRQDFNEVLVGCVRQVQNVIREYFKYTLTAVLGSVIQDIHQVGACYQKLLQASFMRMFAGHESLLFMEEYERTHKGNFEMDGTTEKRISEAILSHDFHQAEEVIREVLMAASVSSSDSFYMSLVQCIKAAGASIRQLCEANGIAQAVEFNGFVNKMGEMETFEEIMGFIRERMDLAENLLSTRKNSKQAAIVRRMQEIIHTEYSNPNLSIELVAEKVGISPDYAGKLFKRINQTSFTESLLSTRLEKSKELLVKSDLSIQEIVQKIGISNPNYFYSLFKKHTGITPGEFRQNSICSSQEPGNPG